MVRAKYIDITYILFRNLTNTSIIICYILFCSEYYNTFNVWSESDCDFSVVVLKMSAPWVFIRHSGIKYFLKLILQLFAFLSFLSFM